MSDGKKHSVLSPSSAHRWLACTPSVLLAEDMADESSDYAAEGTEAHELAEFRARRILSMPVEKTPDTSVFRFFGPEMDTASDDYASFIMRIVADEKCKGYVPVVYTEQPLDMGGYAEGCFGTADCVIISESTISIIDFKYGKGVEVSAENNPQMMLYALGCYSAFSNLYDIKKVKMTIFQPRMGNISEAEIPIDELLSWAEQELKPKAELALRGEGVFKTGGHCRFCKARAVCRARADENLKLGVYELRKADLLHENDLKDILSRANEFRKWLDDVEEYCVSLLVKGGRIDGYKLVEGRSIRRYTDEDAVAKAVSAFGIDPYEKKLYGITALSSMLGKQKFEELVAPFIEKPKGKPTVVPVTDKRQAINVNDFVKEEEN